MTIKFSEKSHRYWLDGRPAPGVTSLLKGYPKPFLTYWAARTVAEYVADNEEAVATLRATGRGPLVAALKESPWQKRDDAALRGTDVHDIAERVIQGHEVDVPDRHLDLIQGYVNWLDHNNVEPVLVERPIANRQHWYCGKFDLIAKMRGETWLLDIKTSGGVYGEYAMQLTAYGNAEVFLADDTDPNSEEPMPGIDRYGVIHVEDGQSTLHEVRPECHDAAFRDFLHAAWLYRAKTRVDGYFLDPYAEQEQPA